MTEDAPQRDSSLREVFNGLRWIVQAGAAWCLMPHDLPPWYTVYQQKPFLFLIPSVTIEGASGTVACRGENPWP
jgi:transposase